MGVALYVLDQGIEKIKDKKIKNYIQNFYKKLSVEELDILNENNFFSIKKDNDGFQMLEIKNERLDTGISVLEEEVQKKIKLLETELKILGKVNISGYQDGNLLKEVKELQSSINIFFNKDNVGNFYENIKHENIDEIESKIDFIQTIFNKFENGYKDSEYVDEILNGDFYDILWITGLIKLFYYCKKYNLKIRYS